MKILAPAGNFECLKVAVYNGADEVYLGINEFNARNNVDGFTLENLSKAVDFAHLYGVKVNLALNILFDDSELLSAVNVAVKAFNMGVDAFIVQDLGLIKILSSLYPQIKLHASTQMGIHNLEGVNFLEKYNIKRVVLSRETPLAEIKRIRANSKVEIEYFCQGALCVSFSGNCYLSSYLFNMSGNRGRCKQLCRLPFTLEKDGKKLKKGYLLSAKDFNMSKRLDLLKDAGVDVIKIEGRARRPFYVATTTREYFNALHGKVVNQDNIKLAFNRTYTVGYFDGNGEIISEIQNHIGIEIGRVERVNLGKNFNEIYFSSTRKVSAKSVLKFLGDTETTLSAYDLKNTSGGYKLTSTKKVRKGDRVYLIVDYDLENETLAITKKRPIDINICAYKNMPITASVKVDNHNFSIAGSVCLPAVSQPLTQDEIRQNFSKSQLFDGSITVNTDGAFLPKKELNELRRMVYEKAENVITNGYKRQLPLLSKLPLGKVISFEDFVFVDNLDFNVTQKNVVYSPEVYTLNNVTEFIKRCQLNNKTAYLDTPNFALEKDILLIKDIISKTQIPIIANNYYALSLKTKKVIGGGLNVYNSITADEFSLEIITAEGDLAPNFAFPYMTLRHCPMKAHLSATCERCPYTDGFVYKMDDGKALKLKRKKLSTCTFYLTD